MDEFERYTEIPKWSKEKLELLNKYLFAYLRVMKNQQRKYHWPTSLYYIDAFAGPGIYINRDEDETSFVEGSPLIALKLDPSFDKYIFIETCKDRVERLESLKAEYPDVDIRIINEDSNLVLENISEKINKDRAHGIIFLDPYGLQVNWLTISKLTNGFDIFVNFPLMGIYRALLPYANPTEEQKNEIARVMGDDEVIQKAYQQTPTLFGEENLTRNFLPPVYLAEMYQMKLKALFPYVSNPKIMKNSKNSPLYALFVASKNDTAIKIANDIFKRKYLN